MLHITIFFLNEHQQSCLLQSQCCPLLVLFLLSFPPRADIQRQQISNLNCSVMNIKVKFVLVLCCNTATVVAINLVCIVYSNKPFLK